MHSTDDRLLKLTSELGLGFSFGNRLLVPGKPDRDFLVNSSFSLMPEIGWVSWQWTCLSFRCPRVYRRTLVGYWSAGVPPGLTMASWSQIILYVQVVTSRCFDCQLQFVTIISNIRLVTKLACIKSVCAAWWNTKDLISACNVPDCVAGIITARMMRQLISNRWTRETKFQMHN